MDPATDPDLALVRACQERSTGSWDDAFHALHERHKDVVLAICLRATGDVHDALDATQEAFLLAYRGIHGFRYRSRFSRWLFRIARHVSIELRRRRRPLRRFSELEERLLAELRLVGPRADPRTAAELRERRVLVRRALRRLSPHMREILALRYFEGLSYAELARHLAIASGSVKSRLHRAHLALGARLEATADEL